jgi:hypothetical protein
MVGKLNPIMILNYFAYNFLQKDYDSNKLIVHGR